MPLSVDNFATLDLQYHPTIWDFMKCDDFVRGVIGPVGSGKSTGVGCGEIMRRALLQEPSPIDNIRPFRALIVRNSYPQLKKTTVQTWQSVFPPSIGKFTQNPLQHTIFIPAKGKYGEEDNMPGLSLTVWFIALDAVSDIANLLSMELTLIWFNEVREILRDIVMRATERVGRYPSIKHNGVKPTWYGIIMDSNPVHEGHWLDVLEKDPPKNWKFFRQPPGVLEMEKTDHGYRSIEPNIDYTVVDEDLIHKSANTYWAVNPNAENLPNLSVNKYIDPSGDPLKKGGYYANLLQAKTKSEIQIYI